MAPRNPQALLEQALALPDAHAGDFFGDKRPPVDAVPHHLKVIKDTALRARLIAAGLAEGLQSPKGPQKITSIIRVYPHFNAPAAPMVTASSNGHVAKRPGRPPGRKSTPQHSPTVEEMEALLTRIRAVEGHAAREISLTIDQEIEQLKRRVAEAPADRVDEAYRALGVMLDRRRDSSRHVREEAFRRIESDREFAPRVYLRFLSPS